MLNKNCTVLRKTELKLFHLDKGNREKKDKKKGNGNGSKSHPLITCPRCGKLERWRWHHGWPQWIDKRLKALGITPEDVLNYDKDELCDSCHEEIEEINRKFEAVRMESCKSAVLEMKRRFIAGEEITDDYIIAMARGVDFPPRIAVERGITQKEEVSTEAN